MEPKPIDLAAAYERAMHKSVEKLLGGVQGRMSFDHPNSERQLQVMRKLADGMIKALHRRRYGCSKV